MPAYIFASVEIIDPAAKYGLRVTALSPEIKAIQVYAPPERNVVAIEPQFNLADPYSKSWGKTDTGMVMLQPVAFCGVQCVCRDTQQLECDRQHVRIHRIGRRGRDHR